MHSAHAAVARTSVAALVSALLCAPSHAVDADYDVRMDDTTRPGRMETGLHAVYTPSGARDPDTSVRSGVHVLQLSPTFSWGLTRNTDIELQVFTSAGAHGDHRFGGAKVELAWVPLRPAEDEDGYWIGGAIEAGRLPRTQSPNDLDAEVKALLGGRRGPWTVALNPAIQTKIAGPGSRPTAELKALVAYRVDDTWTLGLEHHASLGELAHIGPLNEEPQHTFATVEWKAKAWQVNFGAGRGHNSRSERWILKSVLSLPFGY